VTNAAADPRGKVTTNTALAYVTCFLGIYAAFDILPIVLPKEDVLQGVRWGDLADAPLLFGLLCAWIVLGLQAGLWRNTPLRLANAFALALLIQGHGIHLAANTISAYLDASSAGWRPAYFLDEHWGHTELHLGILLEAAIFVVAAKQTLGLRSGQRALLLLLAGVFGLFLTADAIEGQTVPLMLPAGIVLAALLVLRKGRGAAIHSTFFATAGVTLVLALLGYGAWHGGTFPEHDWHIWQLLTEGREHCC